MHAAGIELCEVAVAVAVVATAREELLSQRQSLQAELARKRAEREAVVVRRDATRQLACREEEQAVLLRAKFLVNSDLQVFFSPHPALPCRRSEVWRMCSCRRKRPRCVCSFWVTV